MTKKLYPSLFISIFFHGFFIVFLIFGIRNSVHDFKNLTYVTLISNSGSTVSSQTFSNVKEESKIPSEKPAIKSKDEVIEKSIEKINKSKEKEEFLQERLAALRAKKRILESKGFQKNSEGSLEVATSGTFKGEGVSSSYLSLISALIRQNWSIPETVPKNLEAIVSVRILSNGQIIVEGFEKRSGNSLFDSSVIKALKNSSPLPPPKVEVIVGLRFKP